jgi:hypothetical protein
VTNEREVNSGVEVAEVFVVEVEIDLQEFVVIYG